MSREAKATAFLSGSLLCLAIHLVFGEPLFGMLIGMTSGIVLALYQLVRIMEERAKLIKAVIEDMKRK